MAPGRRLIPLALLFAPALAQPQTSQSKPPETPVREVQDTYFGTTLVDPYRWMEKSDAEFQAWLRAQDAYARSILRAIPEREGLRARLAELDNAVGSITSLQRAPGDLYFYYKTAPGSETRKLYSRGGLKGEERLLVDPETLGSPGRHAAIDHYAPSLDGKYAAYGVSGGGSEDSVLRIVETATGRVLPDTIDRTRFAHVSWLPDNASFFYWRSNKLPPGTPPAETSKRTRAYLHVLGQDPDRDRPVFGYKVWPEIELSEIHYPAVAFTPGSRYLLAFAFRGVKREFMLWSAPLSALSDDKIPWTKVVGEEHEVVGAAPVGDALYLLTHRDAPRYKVIRTSLQSPDLENARTVVQPSEQVLTSIAAAEDGLYVELLDGGIGKLKRISYAKDESEEIPLPFQGTLALVPGDPRLPGALVQLASWTHSPRWYLYAPDDRRLRDTGLQPVSPVDMSGYESLELKAKGADGTLIPLSLVSKKGSKRDGSHPALVAGYGAYGISLLPGFDPKRLAWLERGGILAYAHVRGGGEYGEEWHRAGRKQTKMNTIDDFIACAEYLIEQGYTSRAKLAGTGGSAGGIMVGRAITKRPELFAAIVSRVPASNVLRMEQTVGGPQNTVEFGSVSVKEEFFGMLAMDPYMHVTPGTRYPAVLFTAGANDPRIPPWQPAKLAARLQAASASGKPILLRVDFDAGHGFGSTRTQLREELADTYAFLLWQLAAKR